MTLEHHDTFMEEAADKVRRAILTVLPDADVTTTETAVVMMPDALFDLDDYQPLTVKTMRCASCIGQGCARCGHVGRIGSSIWRGDTCLARITSAWPEDAAVGGHN